jgi:bis(5'-nucleosyl)-tetraphosphatase (symmetrical)
MAVYAIGDVQGCLDELQRLLERLHFDPAADRLWFAGDLVNRGPRSLDTLRFVHDLGEAALSVLGNHDLHLLAISRYADRLKAKDTLLPILEAPDREELLDWLRHCPLFHHDAGLGYSLVHAGLPPQWDLDTALTCSREVEAVLRDDTHCRDFLAHMYGNHPDTWAQDLEGHDRLRVIVNACTRLRFCTPAGAMEFRHSGPPGTQPPGFLPWFDIPDRASHGQKILFGHWASLGEAATAPGVYPLDTGCVWGKRLTALRLDTPAPERISIDCPGARRPG